MKKYLMTLLMLGLACNAAACMEDEPFYDTEIPPHASIDNSKGEGVTRLVTYNVGIFNKYIKDDYQLIADMMKEIDADAICMNELDNNTNRTRHVYQLKHFASLMGSWDFEYGAAMPYDGGEYGEGVTTRKKAVNKFSVALPKGVGAEPRVLVVMEMEDYVICTSHLDHVSSEAQLGQVELITKTMKERYGDSGKPVFLGGDMNAMEIPGSGWTVFSGILLVLCSLWILFQPLVFGTTAVVIWVGISLLFAGIAACSLSIQLRRAHQCLGNR